MNLDNRFQNQGRELINRNKLPWDLMRGYKKALKPFCRPATLEEPSAISMNGKIPFCVLIPELMDKTNAALTILLQEDDLLGEINFTKHVARQEEALQMAVEDINGDFSYSLFTLRVIAHKPEERPLSSYIIKDSEINLELILEAAVSLIRRFTLAYIQGWSLEAHKLPDALKSKADKQWIPEFGYKRLSPWTNIEVINQKNELLFAQNHIDYRGTGVGLGTDLPDDTLNILQDSAMSTFFIEGINGYYRIANRHFHNHEFESFCVLLTASLEKKVFQSLKDFLRKRGKSELEVQVIVRSSKDTRKQSSELQYISRNKALNICFDSKEWMKSDEWVDCEKYIYSIRDDIIHGECRRVSKRQAEQMLLAANNFIEFLNENIVR